MLHFRRRLFIAFQHKKSFSDVSASFDTKRKLDSTGSFIVAWLFGFFFVAWLVERCLLNYVTGSQVSDWLADGMLLGVLEV